MLFSSEWALNGGAWEKANADAGRLISRFLRQVCLLLFAQLF